MAKVLIQQGVERLERQLAAQEPAVVAPQTQPAPQPAATPLPPGSSAGIRAELEQRQQQVPRPLRRGPRRVRLQRPSV